MRVRKVRTTTTIDPHIWQTPKFRDLSQGAQWLWFTLQSHPQLSWAGTLDYNHARLAELATDLIPDDVAHYAHELETMGYIHIDHRTQELLLADYTNTSTNLRSPNHAKATAIAIGDIHSRKLMHIVINTLKDIATSHPYSGGMNVPEIQNLITDTDQQ